MLYIYHFCVKYFFAFYIQVIFQVISFRLLRVKSLTKHESNIKKVHRNQKTSEKFAINNVI